MTQPALHPQTTTAGGASIVIRGLTKAYRVGDGPQLMAADDVDLTIAASTMTALVGPSGSGKSTLLHLIGGIDAADTGTITVDGTDIVQLRGNARADYRFSLGFIFQQFHLIPSLTVLDNVRAPVVGRKVTFDSRQRALGLLHSVGLTGRETSLPSQLSGGQQQRVAIARALINQPRLILADEPTGNLDSHNATQIVELLRSLQQNHGTTLILATHDTTISTTADTTIHISDGRANTN